MTPTNVIRGTVALASLWIAGVPAVIGGEVSALAFCLPGFAVLVASMFVRHELSRRVLTTSALLVLVAAAAMTVRVSIL